jgi:type I restriction enzyme S subunit
MIKYQSYKQSGLVWIGEIPSHWIKIKIKHCFHHKKGINGQKLTKEYIGENPGQFPVYSGVTKGDGELGRINEYEFEFLNSVILVSTVGSESTVMSTRLLSGKFSLSQNCMIMIPTVKISTKYFHYLVSIDFPYRRKLLPIILKEGHRSVGMGEVNEFEYFLPLISEQLQIVQFLDEKTELINKLISTKERKITLLKEQRTSLINEVVTKGLNPNVKMKDSGVEWIGDIPEHWEITKLKYLVTFDSGYSFNSSDYVDEGVNLIRIGSLYDNTLDLERSTVFLPIHFLNQHQNFVVKKNDILISLTGTLGKRDYGYSIVYDKDFPSLLNQRVGRLKLKSEHLNFKLFTSILHSEYFLNQLFCKPTGTKQGNFSSDDIISNYIFLPPNQEQLQIVEHLDSKTREIDDFVQLEQKKIDLLKEYRQSLISEVVTGKIKVTTDE